MRQISNYLGATVRPRDFTRTSSGRGFKVEIPGRGPVFAKPIFAGASEHTEHSALQLADREIAVVRRLQKFDAPVPPVIPRGNAPLAGEEDCSLVVYEWLDLRPIENTTEDATAIMRTHGASVRALELAGKNIGPWETFPNNGSDHWWDAADRAQYYGSSSWLTTVKNNADALGLLEKRLPLDPSNPDAFLYIGDIHSVVTRPPINMFMRDDDTRKGLVVDFTDVRVSEDGGKFSAGRGVLLWASNLLGEEVARAVRDEGYESVSDHEPSNPISNPAQVAAGLRGLRETLGAIDSRESARHLEAAIGHYFNNVRELEPHFLDRRPQGTVTNAQYL